MVERGRSGPGASAGVLWGHLAHVVLALLRGFTSFSAMNSFGGWVRTADRVFWGTLRALWNDTEMIFSLKFLEGGRGEGKEREGGGGGGQRGGG